MKKIVILSCLKTSTSCTGIGCVKAYRNRTGSFENYTGDDVELLTQMHCSHCYTDVDPTEDEGFIKKADRLVQESVDTVHISNCAKKKDIGFCPGMTKMIDMLQSRGINVVIGTH